MNRQQRREIKERKWVSRLRKLWGSNVLCNWIDPVKRPRPLTCKEWEENKAYSYKDFKKDRFGVKCKNTGTILRDSKWKGIKEIHKQRLNERSLLPEDTEEVDEIMEELNDPFHFEKFCGACIYFETEDCPFRDKVLSISRWKTEIKCDKFYD